jgi:NAD(P)-dependent dehydrogenase (short-subunit alcohol dehydrogenase family)
MKLSVFDLKNKVAIVTGAGGLLGQEHCKALSMAGCKIIALDIDIKKLKKLQDIIGCDYYYCNITNRKDIISLKRKILKRYRKIDILINNAAIDFSLNKKNKKIKFENFSIKQLNKEINVGISGAVLMSQIFGPLMVKSNGGAIINIASDLSIIAPNQEIYSHLNIYKPVSYSIIKHGIVGLTKYLASYWGKKNIRVNSLSPGGVFNNQDRLFHSKIKKLIPMNRMANINEYHGAIIFLCSDASKYMNGHNLVIDGGRSII